VPGIAGTEFQARAKAQVAAHGAMLHEATATAVTADAEAVTVALDSGEVLAGDYLLLAEGKAPVLARSLGLEQDERGGIRVGAEGRSIRPQPGHHLCRGRRQGRWTFSPGRRGGTSRTGIPHRS
jgi:flavin-dependent dehydrogenase